MGLLIDGMWRDQWYDTGGDGTFKRQDAGFRDWVTADGGDGPNGATGVKAEADRFHLYVSLACPWAHRTLITRALKGIEDLLPVTVVHWRMRENGWEIGAALDEFGAATDDPVNGFRYAHQLYTLARPDYTGRVTVPIVWDKRESRIVSNESSEIIRMLDSAFDELGARKDVRLSPPELMDEIEAVNAPIYDAVNNGVYKAGFATKQDAYEDAFDALFAELDRLEERLSKSRWLVGNRFTEADVRLFTTLIRFDAVYHGHFKCNRNRIADFEALGAYTRDIYQHPAIRETVNLKHIKHHYYGSHDSVNPTLIVPKGPAQDLDAPHGREGLGPAIPGR